MRNSGKSHLRSLTAAVLAGALGLAFTSLAMAAPPSRGGILGWVSGESHAPRTSTSIRSSGSRPDFGRLDLRAPTNLPADSYSPADAASAPIPFPARRAAVSIHDDERPALGADEPQLKVSGGIQEIAQRVHREGVPVARLWESHSALVSLGLNQRGKPGLWLIQKVK
ncbi:MAG TPA: hypothetical protein VMQ54_11900 [Steroidobacteraceae bacterium]|jgi:hypothetical protein|nr:hypothetical protein [Steroidobacteraceae bacterium]